MVKNHYYLCILGTIALEHDAGAFLTNIGQFYMLRFCTIVMGASIVAFRPPKSLCICIASN